MISPGEASNWKEISSSLSVERQKYNSLRGQYASLASKHAILFANELEQKITNLEDLVQQASDLALPHIYSAIDQAIRTLVEFKITDIDRDYFFVTYFKKYDDWSSALEKLYASKAAILVSADLKKSDQTDRRQGGGPVMGGGFGVEGAAQGIAIATAANLAISATAAAIDLAAKGLNSANENLRKKSIFRDPLTKARLITALESSVLNVHLALLDALGSITSEIHFQRVSVADQEKAQRMLTNLKQGLLNNIDCFSILREILVLNPYSIDAYKFALEFLGDESGEIEDLGKFFHIDLVEEKKYIVRQLIKTDSEIAVISSIETVRKAGKRLGIPVDSEFLSPLNHQLQKMDVDARTVRGQLYSTREEAISAATAWREEKLRRQKAMFRTLKTGVVKTIKFFLYCFIGLIALGAVSAILRRL